MITFEEFSKECVVMHYPKDDKYVLRAELVFQNELVFQTMEPRTDDELDEMEPEFKRWVYEELCRRFGDA